MNKPPTEEQDKIIQAVSSGKTLKVSALAGTGKTSTLLMIAEQYPRRKGLYLAYNAALKKEAAKKFPEWIDCKTVHGLAYRDFGSLYKSHLSLKGNPDSLILNLGIEAIHSGLQIKKGVSLAFTTSEMAQLTRDVVRRFTYSAKEDITLTDVEALTEKEMVESFPDLTKEGDFYKQNAAAVDAFIEELNQRLLTYGRDLWACQVDKRNFDIPAEHDTYLKLYQLSKPVINAYDYIMLDEAQDANPCILDILSHQTCQIIYVGDKHQQIYAFRGTINAMDKIQGETFYLTQSFRFGNEIAQEANVILENLGSPSRIKGLPSLPGFLGVPEVPYTVLARTNLKLIEECIGKIEEGWKCCLLADTRSIVSLIRSVFYLWMKKPQWVKDERVLEFPNWKELVTFAREEEDPELLLAVHFILSHGGDALDRLRVLEDSARYPEQRADIVFSTVHKAKGREWERVVLCNDLTFANEHEMNLYYVAVTRASRVLYHTFPNT